MPFPLRLLINAAALWVATQIVPGVSYDGGLAPFLGVALVFGVINSTLRPLTKILTFPLIIVTLGLFALVVNGLIARSAGRNTSVLWLSGGSNINSSGNDPRNLFSLGGFLNLSGLRPDSVTGRHYAIARALYYRKIGKGGEGFLNVPTYLGVSLEAGNVWDQRSDISFGSARKNGSIFLGMDTFLGPVYLGAGINDDGQDAFYLFLGRTF